MRFLLILVLLGMLQSTDDVPSHAPGDGPYAHKEGHVCWKAPDIEEEKKHHCECKLVCDNNGNPRDGEKNCVTFCGSKQCLCHADEGCDMEVGPKRK